VLSILEEIHARGATILMVTHSREVADRGTRIVHMLDGLVDVEESLGGPAAAPAAS
jgi:ABC-type lipoprotein export system ATPase subunit